MPKSLGPENDERRRREDDPERSLRQVAARRQAREPAHYEFQIAFNGSEVGSRLIDLAQRQGVIVWHILVLPEDG